MASAAGFAAAALSPALGAAGLFAWADHWKGSALMLNAVKCCGAGAVFAVATAAHAAAAAPLDVDFAVAGWLVLSGVIGIIIGDSAWLHSLKVLGPRRVVFVDSLKPFLAAALGKYVLGEEVLGPALIAGTLVTTAGVLLVALEKAKPADDEGGADGTQQQRAVKYKRLTSDLDVESGARVAQQLELTALAAGSGADAGSSEQDDGAGAQDAEGRSDGGDAVRRPLRRGASALTVGWLCAVANVVLDCYGSVITKQHGADLTTWHVNAIRFGTSGLALAALALLARLITRLRGKTSSAAVPWAMLPEQSRRDWTRVCAGIALTTFAAPALSTFALYLISLPAYATLTALGPVYALPLGYAIRRDGVTRRAVLGALLAVAGIVPLALHSARA